MWKFSNEARPGPFFLPEPDFNGIFHRNADRSQLSGPRMAVGVRPMDSGVRLRVGGT